MKIYIPDIGDQFILTKDWSFKLFAERRNSALAEYFNYYIHYCRDAVDWHTAEVFVDKSVLPEIRKKDWSVIYPVHPGWGNRNDIEQYNKECREREQASPEFVQYGIDYKAWEDACATVGNNSVPITLPVGTKLKVDRIYIRKGASDFSSISFFATIDKKDYRFWAKLADVNTIEADVAVGHRVQINWDYFYGWGDHSVENKKDVFVPELPADTTPNYAGRMSMNPKDKITERTINCNINSQLEYTCIAILNKYTFRHSQYYKRGTFFDTIVYVGYYKPDVTFVLYDKNNNLIKEFKSFDSVKKKVRELVKK